MPPGQMIIAGARHSLYSSKTPPTHHHTTHKDSDSLLFPPNAFITETRMLMPKVKKFISFSARIIGRDRTFQKMNF